MVRAQPKEDYKHSFQDSVRLVLENTRATEAMAVATAFNNAWAGMGPDQQFLIRKQAALMKKKGYKVRPHLVNYYGAIASALTIENTDQAKFAKYLSVAGKVIEKEPVTQANLFFQNSRDFFEHHALHFTKAFTLRAQDDEYDFEYFEAIADTTAYAYQEPDTTAYNRPMRSFIGQKGKIVNPIDNFGLIGFVNFTIA